MCFHRNVLLHYLLTYSLLFLALTPPSLSRTALAASRLVLSMDPLRDPMSILLALDTHAIATSRGGGSVDQKMILCWMIDMVESDLIRIWHRNTETDQKCDLLNLPNWAYSYALALFLMRSVEENGDLTDIKRRSDEAIQLALSRFPSVVGLLLQSLEVDTTGRSFKRDWITVLDFATARWRQLVRDWHAVSKDNVVLAATLQTCDLVIQIFVQQNAKQWGDDDILQWIYDNMKVLQSQVFDPPPPPSPAIMRYACADPADYDNKLQMLPPDANIINPGLLAHAMVVNPNRPRFLRPMQQRGDGDGGDLVLDANGNRVPQRHLLGPPIHHVDPDWPMVEVFWRSFLPWNHVEGIPPPRR